MELCVETLPGVGHPALLLTLSDQLKNPKCNFFKFFNTKPTRRGHLTVFEISFEFFPIKP